MKNYGLTKARAQEVYNNYMSGFSGLKRYQEFRREDVLDKGYILLILLLSIRHLYMTGTICVKSTVNLGLLKLSIC